MDANREVIQAWVGLKQANGAVHHAIGARMADEIGCSLAEYDLLNRLASAGDGSLRMTELAELVCVSPSAITRMVDRLVGRGWLRRWQPSDNRRVAHAQLTDDGWRTLSVARKAFHAALSDAFVSHLSDRDIADLRRVNEKLLVGLGRWDERRCGDGSTSATSCGGPDLPESTG